MESIDQWPTEIVEEGAGGRPGAGDPDSAPFPIVLNVVGPEEEVVPAILPNDRGSPEGSARPLNVGGVEDPGVFGPGDEIG